MRSYIKRPFLSLHRNQHFVISCKKLLLHNGAQNMVYHHDDKLRGFCSESSTSVPLKTVASIQNRTQSLLKAVREAQNEQSLLIRLERFNEHILQYVHSGRSQAIRDGAIETVLNLRTSKDLEIKRESRRSLALLGNIEPVNGWGIRILSIDGGGSRGIAPIEILKRIEDACNKEIYELFDMVCGVSTGAILAVLIGIKKMPLDECEYVYKQLSMELFERNTLIGTGKLFWTHAFYDTTKLEDILNNYTHPFSSVPRFPGSCQYKIWEALKASCAAPGFFEECRLDNDVHQDGGLLTNNPTAIAIHEARLLWPSTPIQCILSLGTGVYKGRVGSPTPSFSSLREKLLKVVASATDTEAVDIVLKDLLPKFTYFRLNPNMSEDIAMDECRAEMLEQVQTDTKIYIEKSKNTIDDVASRLLESKTLSQRLQDKWNRWKYSEYYDGEDDRFGY